MAIQMKLQRTVKNQNLLLSNAPSHVLMTDAYLYISSITRVEGHKTILKVRTLSSVPQVILLPRDCGLFLMQKFLPLKEMISSAGNCQCKRYLEFDTEGMVHPVSSDKMACLQWRTQNVLPLVIDGICLQFM